MSSITLDVVHELGLPENAQWRDTGCSWHAACLTCPFDKCRYDMTDEERFDLLHATRGVTEGHRMQLDLAEHRRQRIRELRRGGRTVEQVCRELRLARSTVLRAGR